MITFNTGNSTWKVEGGQQTQSGAVDVTAGRVSTFDFSGTVVGIASNPEGGHVSINPDGTVALVMTDPKQTGATSFVVEVATSGGGTRSVEVNLDVEKPAQLGGWGAGDHYMLATDESGQSVVEAGENHRKVYVTDGKDGLSLKDIADREGLSVSQITAEWLVEQQTIYGATENMALNQEAGARLWYGLTEGVGKNGAEPGSHWLLLERGHTYEDMGRIIARGAEGESALHPLLVTSWGEGDNPVIDSKVTGYQEAYKNIAIMNVDFGGGLLLLEGENILIDGTNTSGHELNFQYLDKLTYRNSTVVDAVDKKPHTEDKWNGSHDRKSGLFVKDSDGILIEDTLADHNGWEDGYDYNLSADDPMPPSNRNHNYYFQKDVSDLTFRDNVSFEGAQTGAQVRAGGIVENNAFIGDNAGILLGAGKDQTGNYSLMANNVITLAGYKEVSNWEGFLAVGLDNKAIDASLVNNVIAHLSDPTDTAAINSRTSQPGRAVIEAFEPFTDNTIIYNWETKNKPRSDRNLPDDISKAELDDVTVKSFVEDVLGLNAGPDGLDALSDWLRKNWNSDTPEAKIIVDYFLNGFGIDTEDRTENTTVRFVPTDESDGVRWDQALNWSTDDTPIDGDSVDLGGNYVSFGGTVDLAALDLGDRGVLSVRQGLLETNSFTAGSDAELKVGFAGQFWTNGYSGPALDITVDGGRFANTGAFNSTGKVSVSDGEFLFGAGGGTFNLDGRLNVIGSDAKLGFDGQGGTAALVLDDDATVSFKADSRGDVAGIEEFRSGHWGTVAPKIGSIIDFGAAEADLVLNGIKGNGTQVLFAADELSGGFENIDINNSGRLALSLDYGTDTFTASVIGGSGSSVLEVSGSAEDEVFYVSSGVQNLISDYQSQDVIDLSALINANAGVSLKSIGNGATAIVSGNKVLVQLEKSSGNGDVTVTYDGTSKRLKTDGSIDDIEIIDLPKGPEVPVVAPTTPPAPTPTPEPTPTPPVDAPPSTGDASLAVGRTEIENLDLSNYNVQDRNSASDGAVVRTSGTGAASGVFGGASGTYEISVGYLNEDDGRSTWNLLVNGEVVGSWDGRGGTGTMQTATFEVALREGDQIAVTGQRQAGEFARLDWIDVTSAESISEPTPVDVVTQLVGNGGNNRMSGSGGMDSLWGDEGNDTLFGGNSQDELWGGADNDRLYGGNGADTIFGEDGKDMIIGGNQGDLIDGGLNDDVIDAGNGNDTVYGGSGNDTIYGGTRADVVRGDNGFDLINGGGGSDTLSGNNGNDTINGEDGNDRIWGGNNHDLISGGGGYERIYAGNGNDTVAGDDGRDTAYLGDGNDVFEDNGQTGIRGGDRIFGVAGDDVIHFGGGNDSASGGSGADTFSFNMATIESDRINDFEIGVDALHLGSVLWGGAAYDASEVIDRFADDSSGTVIFDFGDGNTITLSGVTSTTGLEDDISII